MIKKLVLNEDECIGCESCVIVCDTVFEFDESKEKAVIKKKYDLKDPCIQEGIDVCPVDCIYWE